MAIATTTGVVGRWETIDTAKALSYLNRMAPNRKLVQAHVDKLATAMRDGEWVESAGDPIRFDTDGFLIDGQHRLWAVVESGARLMFNVIEGLSAETMHVLDTGRVRSLADFLTIQGEVNAPVLAAALNYLAVYRLKGEIRPYATTTEVRLTIQGAFRLLELNPGLREAAYQGAAISRRLGGGGGTWAVTYHVLSEIDAEDASEFFRLLETGTGLTDNSPIRLLRERMLRDLTIGNKGSRVRELTALTFKTWNAWRKGSIIRHLSFKAGGARPDDYPIPL